MRTATGVFLIIAAVLNLLGSFGYFAAGGISSAGSGLTSEISTQISEGNYEVDGQEMALEGADEATSELSDVLAENSALLTAMGVFMLVSVGILIAGAVFLFKNSNATFVLVAGILALIVEGLGIMLSSFGVLNIMGLVGGVLAIVCGIQMRKALHS